MGHGHSSPRTPTYQSWSNMKDRCLNVNNKQYKDYGGRNITVCESWLEFENFLNDMGLRPKGKTLDRINNNKGYNKKNCKWSNWFEQEKNKRQRQFGSSKIKGVWFEPKRRGGRFVAYLRKENKTVLCKYFKTEKEAIKAVTRFKKENNYVS